MNTEKHDKYCWKCCGKDSNLKHCSICPRSFHSGCIDKHNEPVSLVWWCPVCEKLEVSKKTMLPDHIQRIPIIFDKVYKSADSIRENKKSTKRIKLASEDDIINVMDLSLIKGKVYPDNKYTSLDEFLVDFQWLARNYEILYSSGDVKTKRANKLKELVSSEIDSVKTCLPCHINANKKATKSHWFTMVCDPPHLIIWAHKRNARYWPAKIMTFDDQHVNVRFFGDDHINESVAVSKCFLYSKTSPSNAAKNNDTIFISALKEADQYIANICDKYGHFQFAEPKNKFIPAKHNEYIQEIISGVRISPKQNANNENNSGNLVISSCASVKMEPSLPIDDTYHAVEEFVDFEDDVLVEEESVLGADDFEPSDCERSLEHFTKSVCGIHEKVDDLHKCMKMVVIKNQAELKNQIAALKRAHNNEISKLKEEHKRLYEKQNQELVKMVREHAHGVADAKKNKYCVFCDKPEPLDIHICGLECPKRP